MTSSLDKNYAKAYGHSLIPGANPALILIDLVQAYFEPDCELYADVDDALLLPGVVGHGERPADPHPHRKSCLPRRGDPPRRRRHPVRVRAPELRPRRLDHARIHLDPLDVDAEDLFCGRVHEHSHAFDLVWQRRADPSGGVDLDAALGRREDHPD